MHQTDDERRPILAPFSSRPPILDDSNAWRYYSLWMIRSFRCRHTAALFHRERPRKFPAEVLDAARRKLLMLHAATRLESLTIPPANRLEKLKGTRKGQCSIRINDQWRICFQWRDGNAYEVEIVDCH